MLKHKATLITGVLFGVVWGLYALTAAPGTIFGDPSEYQFIPAIWGIAHPPGYAFYTLLAGTWQRLFPVGSVAFRTNLLAGAAGAWAVTRVFLIVLEITRSESDEISSAGTLASSLLGDGTKRYIAALLAALALAVASDFWQHSIHSNAHIVSVALTTTQLWLLVRWSREGQDAWLYAFCVFAGLGVTHHPITVFGFPAYTLFIILCRPRILLQPKTLALMVLCGIAGLAPWLYFPLRSPSAPFGPTDMATWEGFLRHATAQGLRVNLFHFGLPDQLDRLRVFWTLLRLQYAWPLLIVIGVGVVLLPRRKPRQAVLMGLFLLGHLAFTLNSVQDVMAYLLHAFAALAILLGVGGLSVLKTIQESKWLKVRLPLAPHQLVAITACLLFVFPLGTMIYTFPRISLREWDDADVFIAELWERFEGQTEAAAFVSDWEHLTPYFYHTYVAGKQVAESDLHPVYVTAAQPWPDSVFGNLPLGPVYLSNYRRDIRQLGFRLRPDGGLWQVLEPPAELAVTPQYPLDGVWVGEHIQLLGYDLPETTAEQGETVPLILYAQAPVTQSAILMPSVQLGQIEQRWTTDSRRLTPEWLPGEVIAEQYEVLIPYTLLPGNYSLVLRYNDVTAGAKDDLSIGAESSLLLGYIDVLSRPDAKRLVGVLENSLTNIGNEVALRSARVRVGLQMRRGIWERPLPVQGGQVLHLTLTWRALQPPRTSYTVFVHLLDGNGQPVLGHDYTPLGGAFPSYLWFPKWLEGQQVIDPYRLVIPDNLPSGQYWLEVGMYEMGSVRRVPMLAVEGTMTGDRLVLGAVNKE